MPKQNQHKTLADTINGIDQLPEGFRFNSSSVWYKLEKDLSPKKKNHKVWLAAAAVLTITFGSYISLIHHPFKKELVPTQPKNTTRKNAMVTDHPQSKQPDTYQQKLLTGYTTIQKEIIVNKHSEISAQPSVEKNIPNDLAVLPESEISSFTNKKDVAVSQLPVSIPATTKPVLKKLRVIHLNELNKQQMATELLSTLGDPKKGTPIINEERETIQLLENTRQILYFKVKSPPITTIIEN